MHAYRNYSAVADSGVQCGMRASVESTLTPVATKGDAHHGSLSSR